MGVQITPGQRCLLEILQRKLIGTLQEYAKLSQERKALSQKLNDHVSHYSSQDRELTRLREKIKRISARQKRFTSEIVNGNGNNTIPKESFLKALGLVTRETLQQINSKSNERRRRTTANPRFSHEAIQAKKALQKPRIEPRVTTREKRNAAAAAAAAAAASAANAASETTRNQSKSSGNKNDAGHQTSNGRSNRKGQGAAAAAAAAAAASANVVGDILKTSNSESASLARAISRVSSRQKASPEELLTEQEKIELYAEFKQLGIHLELRAGQVKKKLENKKRLDEDAKLRAILLKQFCENTNCPREIAEELFNSSVVVSLPASSSSSSSSASLSSKSSTSSLSTSNTLSTCSSASTSPQPPAQATPADATNYNGQQQQHLNAEKALAELGALDDRTLKVESPHSDTWMRCEESLDGLD